MEIKFRKYFWTVYLIIVVAFGAFCFNVIAGPSVTGGGGGGGSALSEEQVEDFVGGMLGGTETFITATYQDSTNDIDFVVPVKDEDAMTSNSVTFLATQQSIKAYVDTTKFTGQVTVQEFANADATPDVSNAATMVDNVYYTNENGQITDFVDSDGDHTDFADGDWFILRGDDANTSIKFNANAKIEGNEGVNFTFSATQIVYLAFMYEDARWNCRTHLGGMSSPGVYAVSAINMAGGSLTLPTVAGDLTLTSGKVGVDTPPNNK